MKSNKKIRTSFKIASATAFSAIILTPSMASFANGVNTVNASHAVKPKTKKETVQEFNEVNVSDVQATFGSVNYTKTVNNGTTTDTAYKSENIVPATGTISTTGTNYLFNIPVEIRSKSGQSYNLTNCSVTINPQFKTIDGKPLTAEQQQLVKALTSQIQSQFLNYPTTWSSTGSYTFNATMNINASAYGLEMTPVVTMHYTVNGKTGEQSENLPNIQLTKKYNATVGISNVTVKGDDLGIQIAQWHDGSSTGQLDPYNIYNNDTTAKLKQFTFKPSAPAGVILTPISNPDLIKNADGSYTVKGKLLTEMESGLVNIFKVKYPNKPINSSIVINQVNNSVQNDFDNYQNYLNTNTVGFSGGSTNIQNIPNNPNYGKSIDVFQLGSQDQQSNLGSNSNGANNIIQTTYSSNINSVVGNGTAYVGSAVAAGLGVYSIGNICYAGSPSNNYVELPSEALQQILYGTTTQKAEIWANIVGGKYPTRNVLWALQHQQSSYNFKPNFIYTSGQFNAGQKLNLNGQYYKYGITGGGSKSVTSTYLVYNQGDANSEVKAFQPTDPNSDQIFNNDGNVTAIISPSNETINSIGWRGGQSTAYRDGEWSNGVSSGAISTSSVIKATFDKFPSSITDSPVADRGIPQNNDSSYQLSNWLSQPHTVNVSIGQDGVGDNLIFDNGNKIVVNLGAPCNITGAITFNGKVLPKSDYVVDGQKVTITFPNGTPSNLVKVAIPVQYTNMNTKSVQISATPISNNKFNQNTKINGTVYTNAEVPTPTSSIYTSTVNLVTNKENYCQHYAQADSTQNQYTLTDELTNENSTTTTYDLVGQFPTSDNNTLAANSGYPSNGGLGSNALSIDAGNAPVWVLPASVANNPENQAILHSSNVNELKDLTPTQLAKLGWVKYTPGMDLSKMVGYFAKPTVEAGQNYSLTYKVKLTNVNNGAFQTVSSEYKYLDTSHNIGSTSPVVTLYPSTENLGESWVSSVSVQSYGKNASGQTIVTSQTQVPSADLTKIMSNLQSQYGNNTLKDIFTNGPDVNPNNPWLLTPPKLTNVVNYMTENVEALANLGYKLDYVTVNGQNIGQVGNDPYSMNVGTVNNWFNNIGVATNTTLTHIHFIISKESLVPITVQVKVIGPNGQVITNNSNNIAEHQVAEGYENAEFPTDKCGIKIPAGYKLVKATVNSAGVAVNGSSATLPSQIAKAGDHVVYYIEQEPTTINVKMEYPNGDIVPNSTASVSGLPGANSNITTNSNSTEITIAGKVINVPKGYHVAVTNVINDGTGKQISATDGKINTVPNFKNTNTSIIIHLVKDGEGSVVTKIITTDGKVLVQPTMTSGEEGANDTSVVPTIPKGWHLVQVTGTDGKTVNQTDASKMGSYIPNKYSNGVQKITYIVAPNDVKVTVSVVGTNGKPITGVTPADKTTSVKYGDKLTNSLIPTIPDHYHIVSINTDGKDTGSSVSGVANNDNNPVVIKIEKDTEYPVSGEIVNEQGKVLGTVPTTNGFVNGTWSKTPIIPAGYHLVKTTINNKDITSSKDGEVNGKYIDAPQKIVWTVAKDTGSVTVKLVNQAGNELVPIKTTEGNVGDKDTSIVPVIPAGYHLVKVIDANGSTVNQTDASKMGSYLPNDYKKGNTTITYIVAKDTYPVSGEIVTTDGKVLGTVKETTGTVGSHFTETPNIPKGYHLVKTTINNKETTVGKNDAVTGQYINQPQKVVWTVARNTGKVVTEIVNSDGKVLVNPVTTEGGTGDKDTSVVPTIPAGYHLVKVTTGSMENGQINPNGKDVSGLPKTYEEGTQIVVWHVEKDNTNVDTTVETENGTIVVPTSKAETIKTNSDLANVKLPKVPKGYKIIGYKTDGGKVINSVEGTAVVGNGDGVANHIVIIVKQVDSTVTTEVVGPKGEVVVPTSTPNEIKIGSPLDSVKSPTIPAGWKIVSITTNGKDGSTVTGNANATPNTIVYHVVKRKSGTVTTEIIDSNGKVLVNPVTTTGYNGDKDTSITPKIPKGYHLVKITEGTLDNNGSVTPNDVATNGLPSNYNTGHQVVVWHVEKDNTTVSTTINENGKTITTTNSTVKTGSDLGNTKIPTLPPHTHITSITVNGKTISGDKITGTAGANPNKIVVNIAPDMQYPVGGKVYIEGQDKAIETVPTTDGYNGDSWSKTPTIPAHYHLVSTSINGTAVTPSKDGTVNGKYDKGSQEIKWVIAPDTTITTKIETTTGKILEGGGTTYGINGEASSNAIIPKVPAGYHLVKIVNKDNKTIDGIPSKYTKNNQAITWIVEKNNTSVNTTISENGKTITTTSNTVKTGSDLGNTKIPTLPPHTHITSITVNGKTISGNKITGTANVEGNNIHITIAPDNQYPVSGKVYVQGENTPISSVKSTSGYVGSTWSETPIIPNHYHIVSTDVDGTAVTPSKDGEVSGKYVDHAQNVKWVIAKDSEITTQIITTTGKVLEGGGTTYGINGESSSNAITPKVPAGYHLVKVVNKDNKTIDGMPSKYTNGNQKITWIVEKNDTAVNITVKTSNGTIVVPTSSSETIKTGSALSKVSLKDAESKIPYGYKTIGYETNGETVPAAKVNGTAITNDTKTPNHIVIIVEKEPESNITTSVVTTTGQILVPAVTTPNRVVGSSTKGLVSTPKIPAGYHLVKVENEGGDGVPGIPSKFPNKDQKITWVVEKDNTNVDTTVKTENGTIVVPTSKAETIKTGSSLSKVTLPLVPKGYKIVGYETDGGKMINSVEGSAIVGDGTGVANHIIVIVKQVDSTVTTQVVGPNGIIVVPTSKAETIKIGSPLEKTKAPIIPVGWKIVGITSNGTTSNKVAGNAEATPNTIVYHVVKRKTGTVTTEIIDSNGKVLVNPVTTTGYNGDKDSSTLPKIPNGYHLVKITEGTLNDNGSVTPNNVATNGLPSDYNTGHQVVVWHVEKNETTVRVVIKEGDKTISETPNTTIKTGSDLGNVEIPSIPANTHITSITVDGKTMSNNKIVGTANANPNKIIVNIAQNPQYPVSGKVYIEGSNEPISSVKSTNGYVGNTWTKTPILPPHYHIVSTSVDGAVIKTPKDGEVSGKYIDHAQNIKWVIAKDSEITTQIITTTGKVLTGGGTTYGINGESSSNAITPKVPAGYHLVKIVNKDNKTIDGMPSKYTNGNQKITWIVEKNDTSVNTTIETPNGTIVVPTSKAETIKTGSDLSNVLLPHIPKGYKIVGYKTNGSKISNEISGTAIVGDGTGVPNHIVIIVEKIPNSSVTTQVLGPNGIIVVPATTTTGEEGAKDTSVVPKIPTGWHLVKIVNNKGEVVTGLPSTYGNKSQTITWIVEKDAPVVKPDNKPVVPNTNKDTGNKIDKTTSEHDKSIDNNSNNDKNNVRNNSNNTEINSNTGSTINSSNITNATNNNNEGIANTQNEVTSKNPKTGDSSNIPFAVGVIGAIAGLFAINKKKKSPKEETNK